MFWINIKGYDGTYQISNEGDVRRYFKIDNTYHIIKKNVGRNGLYYVTLYKDGKRKNIMLHNLYADTFNIPVEAAKRKIYQGYSNSYIAKVNIEKWIKEKIKECEEEDDEDIRKDEILYLKSFLKQIV